MTFDPAPCVSPPPGHLGEPVLLPVWIPLPGLHHSGGVLLPDQHRHGLLPAVCRGASTPHADQTAWLPVAWQQWSNLSALLVQDYRWWWRTFLVSGGSAFYVLIYAIFYFVNKVRKASSSGLTSCSCCRGSGQGSDPGGADVLTAPPAGGTDGNIR